MKTETLLIYKDFTKRKFLKLNYLKFKILNLVLLTNTVNLLSRQRASVMFGVIYYKASISKPKDRCIVTGRSHAVSRDFLLSRFTLRRSVNSGLLYSFSRASW
jgi:ribosomal protein S14